MIHIIRMAHECGDWNGQTMEMNDVGLERFAKLIAAAERNAVIDAINELTGMEQGRNAMFSEGYDYALHQIKNFIEARA